MGVNPELQFSKDGRIAASKSPAEIQLWNVTSGTKFAVIAPGPITQWALRPDGRMVALVVEGHLSLVDPTSRAAPIKVTLPANVDRVDWRADGKVLFATRTQETSVIDLSGAVTATIAAVSGPNGISADGRFLFSRDGAMWDVASNQSKWKSANPSASVAFSADSQSVGLATGQAIGVYDSTTGKPRWEFSSKGNLGSEIAVSPDGTSVAVYDEGEIGERGYEGRGMALWNRGKRMKVWQAAEANQSRPAFSPDGKVLGFIGGDNGVELRLVDARTGARTKQVKTASDVRAEAPHWSADGRTILQPATNGLDVFDVAKGDRKLIGKSTVEVTPFGVSGGAVYHDAVFSPDDGALLIVAEQLGRSIATIVDLKTGMPRDTLEGRTFHSAQWNAPSGLIAIDGALGVTLWDGHSKTQKLIDGGQGDTVREVVFSPNGSMLATLRSPNKEVALWDPKTGARLRALTVTGNAVVTEDGAQDYTVIEGMTFNADGSRIAVKARLTSGGSEQATHIAIYDTANGSLIRTLHAQRHYAYATSWGRGNELHFTPEGKGIVSIDPSGRVDLWNTATDDPPIALIEKATPGPSTLSETGEVLLMGTPNVDVWDLRTRTLTREIRGDGGPIVGARLAHNGGAMAVTHLDRIELHRQTDRAYLTLRVAPVTASPGIGIVSDNGAFTGPNTAAATLRVRDGAETEVRNIRPNELGALTRPTLALDFIAGCPE